jgi:hypothetical protein
MQGSVWRFGYYVENGEANVVQVSLRQLPQGDVLIREVHIKLAGRDFALYLAYCNISVLCDRCFPCQVTSLHRS